MSQKVNSVISIRGVKIGEGIPKICVPIVGTSKEDVLQEANQIKEIKCDIVEWRMDCYEDVEQIEKVKELLQELRRCIKEKLILVTFRTTSEGGTKELSKASYRELLIEVVKTKLADLIDVELFIGDELVIEIIKIAHENESYIIASNHDFNKTPSKEEIITRLGKMQDLGADILKIAAMPQTEMDVITLLAATREMVDQHANRPVVTMSMAGTGVISRLAGELTGSAITFGAAAKASAPGQLKATAMEAILTTLHEALLR